jgi:hypothetical protein
MNKKSPPLHITQHKRFVPDGTHLNPSLSLRTSFMLETLYEIAIKEGMRYEHRKSNKEVRRNCGK